MTSDLHIVLTTAVSACHLFAFTNCAWWQLSLCFMCCYDK